MDRMDHSKARENMNEDWTERAAEERENNFTLFRGLSVSFQRKNHTSQARALDWMLKLLGCYSIELEPKNRID